MTFEATLAPDAVLTAYKYVPGAGSATAARAIVASIQTVLHETGSGCLLRRGHQFHIIAEALRAYVDAHDPASHWPRATKERSRSIYPYTRAL